MVTFYHNGRPAGENASRACVLFDPKDGRIVHIHGVTSFVAGKKLSDADMEKRTFERAASLGRSTSGLKAIHVSPQDFKPHRMYRVDVKRRVLLETSKLSSSRSVMKKRGRK
jgi:hypothetical protein